MWICVYVCVYEYIYACICVCICTPLLARSFSLYTILQCTILYGIWRENGGSEGGRILRNSIAIVLQPCGRCRWKGQ